ncbi:uncharacterized protein LOC128555150 isoform X2 [Mercenaria mercenaria]|uniref:uncharacterized protein LOC128555150 isoform X2 n=1 Tax=Mercenaria mercenaria TaxID=6596 RepID=UPI00234EAC0A|nr:uncharacterized protein LOC128555150 isoform X2 [Mercenaria mercenaria]
MYCLYYYYFLFQGLVIFLFHCALNKQIRLAIERRRQKYASSMLSTVSSTKRFSMRHLKTRIDLREATLNVTLMKWYQVDAKIRLYCRSAYDTNNAQAENRTEFVSAARIIL